MANGMGQEQSSRPPGNICCLDASNSPSSIWQAMNRRTYANGIAVRLGELLFAYLIGWSIWCAHYDAAAVIFASFVIPMTTAVCIQRITRDW